MKDVSIDIYKLASWCRSQGDEIIFVEASQAVVNGELMNLEDFYGWAGKRYDAAVAGFPLL